MLNVLLTTSNSTTSFVTHVLPVVIGIAHLIITEDSDLLVFGCPRVLFKMDQTGAGVLIEKDRLYLSLGDEVDLFNGEKYQLFKFIFSP